MSYNEDVNDDPVVGSIVIQCGQNDMMDNTKYSSAYYFTNYGVVRVKRKIDNKMKVNVEWYVDDHKEGDYEDIESRYVNLDTVRTVAKEGQYMPVEYLSLQDVFHQKTNGKWELDFHHNSFCKECKLRPCLLEERAEDIYYIFAGVRMTIESTRRKRLRAYKEFVMMWHGHLGKGVRVPIPMCCVKVIREEFPKTGEAGDMEYTGFKSA